MNKRGDNNQGNRNKQLNFEKCQALPWNLIDEDL